MKKLLLITFFFNCAVSFSQPLQYSTANTHAHNDYEKPFPFFEAYNQQFGSIEADIFLQNDTLLVAHEARQLSNAKTLEVLYLLPLQAAIQKNNGYVYADTSKVLQLMIDIKTTAVPTLDQLIKTLASYPSITQAGSVIITISGSRPDPAMFTTYPAFIHFDGELKKNYTSGALSKIVMLSDNFKNYSQWNGKGRIPEDEMKAITTAIDKAHAAGKKVRFWNAPDIINSWYSFMQLGVDYINTDQVTAMATFLKQLPDRTYTSPVIYPIYKPAYRNDGTMKPVKNIILLIGDGTGLAQLYAGYTANKGALNVFNMHYTGLSKTSSYDNYITDSAPGSTAFSSGEKTNNRAVGVDNTGRALTLLPVIFKRRKMKTGIITSGDITDATPGDFYAHQKERSSSDAILNDLLKEPIDLIMGKGTDKVQDTTLQKLRQHFNIVSAIDSIQNRYNKPWMVTENKAGLPFLKGRGNWSQEAFAKAIQFLSPNKPGFFLMQEAAQIDHGGHANQLPWLVSEVLDFDQVIAKAIAFADSNGETLVIVTADHETGGLSLTGGDYKTGYIGGQFSTEDHTAIPVPVFAYGPGAQLFTGVYENTAIFFKILQAMGIKN
jgi:alkaline phosphatase